MNTNTSTTPETILLVDDDASIRITVKAILEMEGYKIIEADSGEACLNIYQQQTPDLILMDAVMPGMDGFSCCVELKKIFGYKCPPILMMTVLDDKDSIYRSFDVGITEYVVKPINWDHLTSTIQRLLQNQEKNNELKQQFGEINNLKQAINTKVTQSLKRYNQKEPRRAVSLSWSGLI